MKRSVAALALVLLVAGCDSSTDPGAAGVQGLGPPVATGLFVTDEAGNALGNWRQPTEGGLRSFPNPSGGTCSIHFEVPQAGHVRCWAEAAVPPDGAGGPQTTEALGARILMGSGQPVALLIDQQLAAGVHVVAFNMNSAYPTGEQLPTGFYRIYLQTPEGLSFVDHFGVAGDDFWLPAGLEELVY